MANPLDGSRRLRRSHPTVSGLSISLLLAAALISTAPNSATAQQGGFVPEITLPARTCFVVTRIDPRLCPSPVCGGVYVRRVNRKITRCADGKFAEDCHAPILHWTALILTQEETWQLEDEFAAGACRPWAASARVGPGVDASGSDGSAPSS